MWRSLPARRVCLAFFLFTAASEAKKQVGSVLLGQGGSIENKWQFVSKFGFATGVSTYDIRMRPHRRTQLPANATVTFESFLDERWPEAEATKDPCERRQHASRTRALVIDTAGSWSEWERGTIEQRIRPHVWYFSVSDCHGGLGEKPVLLFFEFVARQEDGSHFSVEQRWTLFVNLVILLCFSLFSIDFSRRFVGFWRSAGSGHPVIWALVSVMGAQYIAQVFHTVHLVSYGSDGRGIVALEVVSEILFMVSQMTMSSLLVVIGLGYTLLPSRRGQLDLALSICFSVSVLHVVLVVITKMQDEQSYRFDGHEGGIGWTLLVLRLCVYAWFLRSVHSTEQAGGTRLQSFLLNFKLAGSLYFLAYPSIVLVVSLFAPYIRPPLMALGLMLMQLVSNVWLSRLFLLRGDYFKVSTLSSSFLPEGRRLGLGKGE